MEFDVTVLVRDLGWSVGGPPGATSPGAYAILEAIRAALTGYRVPGARKIYMVREKFVSATLKVGSGSTSLRGVGHDGRGAFDHRRLPALRQGSRYG